MAFWANDAYLGLPKCTKKSIIQPSDIFNSNKQSGSAHYPERFYMDKSNVGPKYKIIKEEIVEDILSGVYAPGDMIPKQSEYAEKYGVSRLTVRKAIDDLVMKGILETKKGKGTTVQEITAKANCYRRSLGLSSNVSSSKERVSSKLIHLDEGVADKALAKHLQIKEGSNVILIERLRYINDVCVALQKSYIPRKLVGNIDFVAENLDENSLYHVLQTKAGIVLSYVDERFRAIRADEEVSGYFNVEVGDPILYVCRTTYNMKQEPIEYCKSYESSDVNGVWVKSVSID